MKPFIKMPSPSYNDKDRMNDINKYCDINKPVHVYRNLHRSCWSVRQRGRVRFHTKYIVLENCNFVVQPGGRARVLQSNKKNVHAYIRGEIIPAKKTIWGVLDFPWETITYDPYKYETFISIDGDNVEHPAYYAKYVDMMLEKHCGPVVLAGVVG